MDNISLQDIDLLEVGNTIQLYGALYTDKDKVYAMPLPDEDPSDLGRLVAKLLIMGPTEWEKFLHQSDVVDVKGPDKAILRKTMRVIDQMVAWRVYERDGYVCRYCARRMPLTVDHVDLWEHGGATVEANLLAACRRCNKLRGSTPYYDWLGSDEYLKVSVGLTAVQKLRNRTIDLAPLYAMRRSNTRSR